jgi:hypothetical protein
VSIPIVHVELNIIIYCVERHKLTSRVRIRTYFEIINVPKNIKMGHKLQLILKPMLQAPPTWNNLFLIPNTEAVSIINCCWRTRTDLMAEKRNKYCGTTTYIFTHILKLGMSLLLY